MVMLDIFCRDKVLVAHFNHGTRPSADDDAKFVQKVIVDKYRLAGMFQAAQLGETVSEEAARHARYDFLRYVVRTCTNTGGEVILSPVIPRAKTLSGYPVPKPEIYTAHHLDDLVESIAINLLRGTGWRGLAVLDTPGIHRPFLEPELLPENLRTFAPFDKKSIYKYAAEHQVAFRQDPTNNDSYYLRNRLRSKLANLPGKMELYHLWQNQKKLKTEIDNLVQELLPERNTPWQRSWFQNLDQNTALELLRAGAMRAGISATRPQLENFRQAILTYQPGKAFNLPENNLIKFTKTTFYL